jgi:hypothetical protein
MRCRIARVCRAIVIRIVRAYSDIKIDHRQNKPRLETRASRASSPREIAEEEKYLVTVPTYRRGGVPVIGALISPSIWTRRAIADSDRATLARRAIADTRASLQ